MRGPAPKVETADGSSHAGKPIVREIAVVLQSAGGIGQMQAGIAVGNQKTGSKPAKGYEPISVTEADVRGTRPDVALIP
ncbi:MAG: hypothetical protein AUH86_17450 [Acidobacteria bacterium 13_1_40CM_4_58_4]|nr:MAG: hypothetical protein AUH86_17450 [Acidobacteria bacterium 13_1_40CM_4_58_4]